MDKGFFYSLRFAVAPGHHEQARFETLIRFCREARVDDVMFFINCEELNRGHLTREETRPWLETIARGRALLEPLGISTSINPWPTLLHGDRGRGLRSGQDFTLMVDPYGNRASSVACPLCPQWRAYIADIYGLYATLRPAILWVEDDFRLHNHQPLQWGGCFCDLHMGEYSRRAGRELTREEFVRGVLQPGEPHPYRKIWLDVSRDTMAQNAELIGRAVHAASPGTKVGLMSSCPHVHCAEGRDWHGILRGLAQGNAPVSRPTLPAYWEATPQEYLQGFAAYSMLTADMVPAGTEIYPELESFPHSRFSKSRAFTGFQLSSSLALGAGGITLNIFDMMGNGILPREGLQRLLAGEKEFLGSLVRLGLTRDRRGGVRVLVSTMSSHTLRTDKGESMEELYPAETFWARLLSAMGVANTYCVNAVPEGCTVAVSGQYFRNLGQAELTRLFESNYVLMDGEAAHTLAAMGQGGLAGIRSAVWHGMESGNQAFEQARAGTAYAGVEEARISSQTLCGDYVEIGWAEGAEILTDVMSPEGNVAGPGVAVFGGRVFVLPYGRFEAIQGHLTPIRQAIVQSVLPGACGRYDGAAFVEGEPNILVGQYRTEKGNALLLTNCSHDATGPVRVSLPFGPVRGIREVSHANPGGTARGAWAEGSALVLDNGLAALETKALLLEC